MGLSNPWRHNNERARFCTDTSASEPSRRCRGTSWRESSTPALLLILAVNLLAVGCRTALASEPGKTSFSDSAGVQISFTDLTEVTDLPACRAPSTPTLRVGGNEAPAEAQLFRVEGALCLRDGRLAVLNRGSNEVLIFDQDGSVLTRTGSEGEGPGEFRHPIELHHLGSDSLAVWDWALNRVTVVSPAGSFVRAFTPQPSVPNPTGHFGVIDSGRSVIIAFQEVRIPTGTTLMPQTVLLLRYSVTGELEDTIGILPYGEAVMIDADRRMLGSPLFGARSSFAADGHNAYLTSGSDAEVRMLDESLELVRHIRWAPPDRKVDPSDVQALKQFGSDFLTAVSLDELDTESVVVLPLSDPEPRTLRDDR